MRDELYTAANNTRATYTYVYMYTRRERRRGTRRAELGSPLHFPFWTRSRLSPLRLFRESSQSRCFPRPTTVSPLSAYRAVYVCIRGRCLCLYGFCSVVTFFFIFSFLRGFRCPFFHLPDEMNIVYVWRAFCAICGIRGEKTSFWGNWIVPTFLREREIVNDDGLRAGRMSGELMNGWMNRRFRFPAG